VSLKRYLAVERIETADAMQKLDEAVMWAHIESWRDKVRVASVVEGISIGRHPRRPCLGDRRWIPIGSMRG